VKYETEDTDDLGCRASAGLDDWHVVVWDVRGPAVAATADYSTIAIFLLANRGRNFSCGF
jgi:hypothetical protein